MNLRLNLIAIVLFCMAWNLDSMRAADPVRCEGVYPHHLQGVCQDPGGKRDVSHQPNRHIDWALFEKANKMNDKGERGEMMAFMY